MRKRFLTVVSAGALFALALGHLPASATSGMRASMHRVGRGGASDPNVLVNRIGNHGFHSILSQDFTDPGYDIYDTYLADDFSVPGTLTYGWKVQGMRAVGLFFGSGPCDSESVIIYADAAGLPGATVGVRSGAGTLSDTGTYTLSFSSSIMLPKGASYWASMYCKMAYSVGGMWFWSDRRDQQGNSAKLENPGGGFGVCSTWQNMDTCGGITGEPDLQFALAGAAL